MEPIYSFGIQLIQALQALDPALEIVMNFFTKRYFDREILR